MYGFVFLGGERGGEVWVNHGTFLGRGGGGGGGGGVH